MPAAYQDENGKWFKQCSKTGMLFGPVDNREDLSEWFNKEHKYKDGFKTDCKKARNQDNKQYRQNNKEKILQKTKNYRLNNSDKIKQHYKNNREKVLKRCNEYYKNNKEKKIEYRQTPAGLFSKHKASAKRRGINFTLTLEWFEEEMTKPEFNVCYFTGIRFNDEPKHAFSRSLDRISSTKGYTPDNVRWVCFKLNSWKSDLTLDEIAIMFNAMAKHHNINPFEVLKKVVDTQNIRG